jgi:hypothetical protein
MRKALVEIDIAYPQFDFKMLSRPNNARKAKHSSAIRVYAIDASALDAPISSFPRCRSSVKWNQFSNSNSARSFQ